MGFSTIGASVILFAGLLFVTSTTANAYFEAQRDLREAAHEEEARAEFRRATSIALLDGGHDNDGTFYLNATNDGDTVLDLTRIGLQLDGIWSTGSIASKTIDGRITDLWAPGETLRLEVTTANEPARAYLTVETGQGILWTA